MAVSLTPTGVTNLAYGATYTDYGWYAASSNSWHTLDNVDVFGGRDQDVVFDATLYWTEATQAPPWGAAHARFVVDYAAQDGRTYYPIFTSAGNGNASYASTLTQFRFTKPDPYNGYARFYVEFTGSIKLAAVLRLTPIHVSANTGTQPAIYS